MAPPVARCSNGPTPCWRIFARVIGSPMFLRARVAFASSFRLPAAKREMPVLSSPAAVGRLRIMYIGWVLRLLFTKNYAAVRHFTPVLRI
jgi:hypothetical protein